MGVTKRAAVIGAGKIGRHHAKWYHHSGCEVAGYVVSSAANIGPRGDEIRADCPSLGAGYADVAEMLDAVRPDLVSVCSPAGLHHDHALAALRRGIPVLCEKPLVWSDSPDEARRQAAALCEAAEAAKALLAVNLQYSYAAPLYRELVGEMGAPERCEVVLESKGRGAERRPDEVWMELGPHALSLAFALLPGAELDPATVRVETPPRTVTACFDLVLGDHRVATTVRTGQVMEGDLTRRFGLNGALADYAGRNNADGVFCTYLSHQGVEREYTDLMRTSIERFVAAGDGGQVAVTGAVAARNLSAQLDVAAAVARSLEKVDG